MNKCNQLELSQAFSELAAAIPLDIGRCVGYQFFACFVAAGELAPREDAWAVERLLEFLDAGDSLVGVADRFLAIAAVREPLSQRPTL